MRAVLVWAMGRHVRSFFTKLSRVRAMWLSANSQKVATPFMTPRRLPFFSTTVSAGGKRGAQHGARGAYAEHQGGGAQPAEQNAAEGQPMPRPAQGRHR